MYVEGDEFKIKAVVKQIRFSHLYDGYKVMVVQIIEQESINKTENYLSDEEILTGNFLGLRVGTELECLVTVTEHHMYSFQLKLKEFIDQDTDVTEHCKTSRVNTKARHEAKFHHYPDTDQSVEKIAEILNNNLDNNQLLFTNTCVITPIQIGELGTINLNKRIQELINPPSEKKNEVERDKLGAPTFREGDRIIVLEKNDETGAERGDIGIITSIFDELNHDSNGVPYSIKIITVTIPNALTGDKIIDYFEYSLDLIELAYALTPTLIKGHKFSTVIAPIFKDYKTKDYWDLNFSVDKYAKDLIHYVGDVEDLEKQLVP